MFCCTYCCCGGGCVYCCVHGLVCCGGVGAGVCQFIWSDGPGCALGVFLFFHVCCWAGGGMFTCAGGFVLCMKVACCGVKYAASGGGAISSWDSLLSIADIFASVSDVRSAYCITLSTREISSPSSFSGAVAIKAVPYPSWPTVKPPPSRSIRSYSATMAGRKTAQDFMSSAVCSFHRSMGLPYSPVLYILISA